jgi:hypothetical protein
MDPLEHNPYRSPDMPVEQHTSPDRLPTSAYIGAGCSAAFVFVGGTIALVFVIAMLGLPMWLLLATPFLGLLLGGVSAWEAIRLEKKKRKALVAESAPPEASAGT